MSLASIQTLAFISYCLPEQNRMEAANTGVNKFDSVVKDQHICKSVWTSLTENA